MDGSEGGCSVAMLIPILPSCVVRQLNGTYRTGTRTNPGVTNANPFLTNLSIKIEIARNAALLNKRKDSPEILMPMRQARFPMGSDSNFRARRRARQFPFFSNGKQGHSYFGKFVDPVVDPGTHYGAMNKNNGSKETKISTSKV